MTMMDHNLPMRTYRSTILSCPVSFCPALRNGSKRMDDSHRRSPLAVPGAKLAGLTSLLVLVLLLASPSLSQDWVPTGSGLGIDKVRLAVPDFKPSSSDPQNTALLKTFNDTLWGDLDNSGVVELISKSFYPLEVPGQPPEVTFGVWNSPPHNAAMLAFGNPSVAARH